MHQAGEMGQRLVGANNTLEQKNQSLTDEMIAMREDLEQENHVLKLEVAKLKKNSQLNTELESENMRMCVPSRALALALGWTSSRYFPHSLVLSGLHVR
jgi:LytS/YehU family sensor histidine kinase